MKVAFRIHKIEENIYDRLWENCISYINESCDYHGIESGKTRELLNRLKITILWWVTLSGMHIHIWRLMKIIE